MPSNISTWLDENDLVWGDSLAPTFEKAIKSDADYVVIFVNEVAGRSEWVRKEMNWALEREKELKRTFLLPVFIRSEGDTVMSSFPELADRKNIQIFDYTEFGLKNAADQLTAGLFSLICDDLARMQAPAPVNMGETIDLADNLLKDLAAQIQKAVFPYREDNTISVEELYQIISRDNDLSEAEFNDQLERIVQRNLIPGLSYDGYELYLVEEHSLWKASMNHEKKVSIARKAAALVKTNMKVYIDAGSTTAEVVKILCKRIEMRKLTNLSIVTPSVNLADMISDCCVRMGFDDDITAVHLYIPGGIVRPATQAIVPYEGRENDLEVLAEHLGGYDLALIGANGISESAGLTTHANQELYGKRKAFESARKRVILCDDSKLGLELEYKIADLSDDITLISNDNPELRILSDKYPGKIVLT